MSFLAPLFLAGFVALAVPLLLHLTHRERKEPVRFPSLLFVRRVPFRTTERRRIRDWLLFLLRAAAVALIVLAFARPLLQGPVPGGTAVGAARDVVLLLDRSGSMAYGDHWPRAVRAAQDVVTRLGPDDRATLVAFAGSPEVLAQATADRSQLAALLASARPRGGVTRYGPALQLARDLADQSPLPRTSVVLITDFQRNGWDGADVRLPPGTVLESINVGEETVENVAVTDVVLDRSPVEGGRVTVSARIANVGEQEVSVRAELATNAQALQTQRVRVPPGGATLARFAPLALPAQPTPGWVRIAHDALQEDDIRRFVLRPIPSIPVLVVESPQATERETLYLRRALAIGRDPLFTVTTRATRVAAADVDAARVVIVNDAPFPGGAARPAIVRLLDRGGGLLVARGPRSGALPPPVRQAVGDASTPPVDRLADRGGTLGIADFAHPLFAPFRNPQSGDYSTTRLFRYRRLVLADSAHVLAWADDGTPVLAEARYGSGRILLWGSDFGNVWNDLPLKPVFLPTVHQAVRYLSGFREPAVSHTVGQTVALDDFDPPASTEIVIEAPDGTRRAVPQVEDSTVIALSTPGFYAVRPLDDRTAAVPIAVNPDVAESDLTPLDRDAFLAAITPAPGTGGDAPAVALTAAERERRQRLWWYLGLGALLLLGSEAIVTLTRPVRRTA
jgi:hypothetical protein